MTIASMQPIWFITMLQGSRTFYLDADYRFDSHRECACEYADLDEAKDDYAFVCAKGYDASIEAGQRLRRVG